MNQLLSSSEETRLRSQHRLEKNRRKADRLKAVLLSNKGWSHLRIAEALFLGNYSALFQH